ncbi:hypothetical protein KH5_22420 [Urechidicola sp. KH5]
MKKNALALVMSFVIVSVMGQENLPYRTIDKSYDSYNAGTVVARMLDGLGFRFYWATEELKESSLNYKPSEEARTYEETINHILGLSRIIVNSALQQPNDRSVEQPVHSYEQKREAILKNIKTASDIFMKVDDLANYTIVFTSDQGSREIPFWNNINGPIEDAVWHCGQLVSMRRAAGDPMSKKPSFFSGQVRE